MTGDELKTYIKSRGMPLKQLADELEVTPQSLSNKLTRKSVKMDFLSKVEAIIDKCCPPLPAEMNTAVMGNVASYASVQQTAGASAAMERENKFLHEQVTRLQAQLDTMAKQLAARDEQVSTLIGQIERLTQKLTDMLPTK